MPALRARRRCAGAARHAQLRSATGRLASVSSKNTVCPFSREIEGAPLPASRPACGPGCGCTSVCGVRVRFFLGTRGDGAWPIDRALAPPPPPCHPATARARDGAALQFPARRDEPCRAERRHLHRRRDRGRAGCAPAPAPAPAPRPPLVPKPVPSLWLCLPHLAAPG